jgi:hypothetical protein
MNIRWRMTLSRRNGWGSIIVALFSLAATGCAQTFETIDVTSFDARQDQMAIASYYRGEAMVMKEKAAEHAESAVRYEHLFGPQSDWVSGARQLSQYYAEAAKELERRAEAHAAIPRGGLHKRQ